MRKIGISLNKEDFEYDVHSLCKGFYTKEDVDLFYESQEEGEKQLPNRGEEYRTWIFLTYGLQEIRISIRNLDGELPEVYSETIHVEFYKERKETKNQLKRLLYRGLSQINEKKLPWGTLSGIRPTKIPMKLLEEGYSNVVIAKHMREEYYCSNEKIALSITIANRERALLENIDFENGYSLYIGIPFCPSICLYCSFSSSPIGIWKNQVEQYLEALYKEITYISEEFAGKHLDTIYIGGGTPTTLEPQQLKGLLMHIEECFDTKNLAEYTIEAGRPDSITREKLQVIREFPVTRISVNPQTMNQETLEIIGRKHTVEQIKDAFLLARELGFGNINMDLIVGLPGENKEMVAYTLEEIKKLDPDSLTIHSLAVKRAARLGMFKEKYQEMTFENNQEIMNLAATSAAQMQMGPYYLYRQKNMAGNLENVGYAKEDKSGIYNILIMEEKQTIVAAGAGASTKLVFDHGERIERIENVKDVKNYIDRIEEMIQRKKTGFCKFLKQ